MTLYNCKQIGDETSGDLWQITKFDGDMNVESSYTTTRDRCDCPAGQRPNCRHRQMLPRFIARGGDRGEWFLDFDQGVWYRHNDPQDDALDMGGLETEVTSKMITDAEEYIDRNPSLQAPEGITVLSLDDPAALHNAIAEAVGEPKLEGPAPEGSDPKPQPFRRRI